MIVITKDGVFANICNLLEVGASTDPEQPHQYIDGEIHKMLRYGHVERGMQYLTITPLGDMFSQTINTKTGESVSTLKMLLLKPLIPWEVHVLYSTNDNREVITSGVIKKAIKKFRLSTMDEIGKYLEEVDSGFVYRKTHEEILQELKETVALINKDNNK